MNTSRRLKGWVQPLDGTTLSGWVLDLDAPNDILDVRVVRRRPNGDEEEMAVAPAGLILPDLKTERGFHMRIPVEPQTSHIYVYEVSTGKLLPNCPILSGVAPRLEGWVDGLSGSTVVGWAWGATDGFRVCIDIFVDDERVGHAYAVDYRGDLKAAGLGCGEYGFEFRLPQRYFDGNQHAIEVRYRDTGHLLSGGRIVEVLHQSLAPAERSADRLFRIGSDGQLSGVVQSAGDPRPVLELHLDGAAFASVEAMPIDTPLTDHSPFFATNVAVPPQGEVTVVDRLSSTIAKVERISDDPVPSPTANETMTRELRHLSKVRQVPATRVLRFMVPIWGPSYVRNFCDLCLPSLLAPGNIPHLVASFHDFKFVFLTRREDVPTIEAEPAYRRLTSICGVSMIAIDDILDKFFTPAPSRIYPVALTHAFFRGMKAMGTAALDTDFIFWNGDFIAADGAFATLAQSISAGNRCTMAPSLRLDSAQSSAIRPWLSDDGAVLSVPPRDLVRIALENPHPTVVAKTLGNRHGKTIENINQFYKSVGDDILVARSFLMFMLHIRPEVMNEEPYGFCDYAFVPEMVVHGQTSYVTRSDDLFIAEIQDSSREAEYISNGDLDPVESARTIDYWATAEHVEASRRLLVFNGSGGQVDYDAIAGSAEALELDRLLDRIYRRLSKDRPWHNQHIYWRDAYRLLAPDSYPGYEQPPAPPTVNRDETIRQTRWTGYDVGMVPGSWQNPPVNLVERYRNPPVLTESATGATARWLDDLFDTHVSAWLLGESRMFDEGSRDLCLDNIYTSGTSVFYNSEVTACRWGFREWHDGRYWRLLGPGGSGIILHQVTQRSGSAFTFIGRRFNGAKLTDLDVIVNGRSVAARFDAVVGDVFSVEVCLSHEDVVTCGGRLVIILRDLAGPRDRAFAIASYMVRPDSSRAGRVEPDEYGRATPRQKIGWTLLKPTAANIRDLAANQPRLGIRVCDEVEVVGYGWRPNFRAFNRYMTWAGLGEVFYLRATPGANQRIQLIANSVLSLPDRVLGCRLHVNGVDLGAPEVTIRGRHYYLEFAIERDMVDAFDGLLSIRIYHPVEILGETTGFGRIEFAEPSTGAIALEEIIISDEEGRSPAMCPAGRPEVADKFSLAFARESASPTRRQLAATRGGADYQALCSYIELSSSALVQAAWLALPPGAENDVAAVCRWLDGVDAALVREAASRLGGDPVAAETVIDDLGSCWGGGRSNAALPDGRIVPKLLASRSTSFVIKLDRTQAWNASVRLRGPIGETLTLYAPVVARPQASAAVALTLPATSELGLVGDWSVEDCIVRPLAATAAPRLPETSPIESDVETVLLGRPVEPAFVDAARRFGLDPWALVGTRDDSTDPERFAIVRAFRTTDGDLSLEAALLRYLQYRVACEDRTPLDPDGAGERIALGGRFAGIGWGRVTVDGTRALRHLGSDGTGIVLIDLRGSAGKLEIKVRAVGHLGDDDLRLSVNGVRLGCRFDFDDGGVLTASAAFEASGPGLLALEISHRSGSQLGLVDVAVVRAQDEELPAVDVANSPAAAAALLGFPADGAELEKVAGTGVVPDADLLLWRFARDPLPYRLFVDALGGDVASAFASIPTGELSPSVRTKAWLDLVDRTIAEAIVDADAASLSRGMPVFGEAIGLGWGRLSRGHEGFVRCAAGSDDAVLFIPPRQTPYLISIRLDPATDRSVILALQASVNRRAPTRHSLVFSASGPVLQVGVTRDQTDFAGGWAAVRLSLAEAQWNHVSAMFRPLEYVGFWPGRIAVRDISIRPFELTERESATAPVETSGIRLGSIGAGSEPSGNIKALAAGAAFERPAAVHCVIPVWGEEYVRTFLEAALPTHLTAGNLGALADVPVIYEIYTDEEGEAAIRRHELFRLLAEMVDTVQFFDIRRFRYEEYTNHVLTLNYSVMNKAHQRSIARASAGRGALLFLNSDTIYSESVFARVWERCLAGYRTVENLSIRTDRDRMLAAIEGFRGTDGTLAVGSSDMTRVALRNLHWIALGRFWNGHPDLTIPDNIYWHVAENAILARATHYMPLFVFPRVREVIYSGTIDHGFVPASGVRPEEIWRFEHDSEPSSWELSLTSHDQHFPPYERGSVRDIARFLSNQCDAVHIHNLMRPVRIAADPVPEERWQEVMAESDARLAAVRVELQHYVLTPWRPDYMHRPEGSVTRSRRT